jgi:hypothetical protein
VQLGKQCFTAHARCMPLVGRHRAPGVMIIVSLLLGCNAPDGTRKGAQTQDAREQVPPELIAFVSDREGSEALFVMRSDGSGVRRPTGELPDVSHPSWSADG